MKLRKLELETPPERPNASFKNHHHIHYTFWYWYFLFNLIVTISSDCNFTVTPWHSQRAIDEQTLNPANFRNVHLTLLPGLLAEQVP